MIDGGSGLTYKTYVARERALIQAGRGELAQAAAAYQALAALELGETKLSLQALDRYTWDGDSDWQLLARTLKETINGRGLETEAMTTVQKRALATITPLWRDPSPAESVSSSEKLSAAAIWAWTGQIDSLRTVIDDLTFEPTLVLPADGDVPVDYVFFDAAIFRIEAAKRTGQLYEKVLDKSDVDSLLIALWCQIYLQRYTDAQGTVGMLKKLAKSRKLSGDQIGELQFLGAALAERLGQSEQVVDILRRRTETPPESPWALRAMSLLRGHLDQRMVVLRQVVSRFSQNSHPFAREVLTNVPATTERVLDCYWEVAWGHRCQAIEQDGWRVSDAASTASLRARRLVAELGSPSVLESWRPLSTLRLESIFEANLAAGEAETWQLSLREDQLSRHPILEPVVQLSRTFSGLVRTGLRDGDIETLANDHTENLAHLLLGEENAARIETRPAVVSGDSSRGSWTLVFAALIAIVVATVLVAIRRKGTIR
jgi:hypothetical protein